MSYRSVQHTEWPEGWIPVQGENYKHYIFFHKPFIKWLLYIQTNIYPK